MNKLNIPFEETYIIHLASDKLREELLNKELERLGIKNEVIWHNGVHIPFETDIVNYISRNLGDYTKRSPIFNCVLNHYLVIKQAYERGVNSILIIEDDMVFNKDIDFVQKYFNEENFPNDWHILRWNTTFFDDLKENINYIKYNDYFNKYIKCTGTKFGSTGCYALDIIGMKYYIDYIDSHGYIPADNPWMAVKQEQNHYIINTKYVCEGRSADYNHTGLFDKTIKTYITEL